MAVTREREADRAAVRVAQESSSEADVRAHTGRLLGYDFSAVRLHRESAAAAAEGAHAVTTGFDVHLAPGRFRPDLPLGRALLAHELVHVAQQGAAPHRRLASLTDPTPGLTPAPLGMRQRCIAGCKSYSSPSPSKEHAGETLASPPDAGRQTLDANARPADAGVKPADSDLRPPDAGELTEDAGIKAPTRAPAFRIAGANPPRDPYRIIHVSWTMDDGPTPATPKMKTVMGGRPTTWFIMRTSSGRVRG
jgi:hypothetical protein